MPALQSGCYKLTWEECADLPSPMYDASAVLHKENVYVMAGDAPQIETYYSIFFYNLIINEWNRLPPPGHYACRLQIIDDKLTAIGGCDNATNKVTSKVSTFDNNSNNWTNFYPNMLNPRGKPGVVTHQKHVIVLGGAINDKTSLDDIEVLNWSQPLHWVKSSTKLPVPMWYISLTISHNQLYIVGFSSSDGRFPTACQLPIDSIILSTDQPPTSHLSANWTKLPDAPHYDTALLPHSDPPVIIGGHDTQFIPTCDVAILNITKKTWHRVASLSTPRSYVAVVPISTKSVLVIGGTNGGEGIEANKASSVTTVEKGTVTLSHTMATTPARDNQCTIQ